jgi:CubicO group peptidase (beta-lactamase class C family)
MYKLIRKVVLFIIIAGGFIGCSYIGTTPTSYDVSYTKPPETDDGWRTAEISDVGLDPSQINRLLSDIHQGALKNIYAVMIVKDGLLVVDEYFNGADRTNILPIASTTKSLVSLLVGIALDESISNKSVDSPLREFFPSYADLFTSQEKRSITLYHVLTMTAGLDWDESTFPHPDERNPNTKMYQVDDPIHFILNTKSHSPPGKHWNYNSGLSVLLGEVVHNLSGEHIDVFAESHLFDPLKFTRYQWNKSENGTLWSNGDLYIRPRDLAKVGQLVLNEGKWNGQQIVSAKWIKESTRFKTRARYGCSYGYQWWLGSARYTERRLDVIFGSGTGGQKLFIIPEVNMVVVVMSKVFGNKGGQERATKVLTEYVLPASLPESDHAFSRFDATFANRVIGKYYNPTDNITLRIVKSEDALYARPIFFSQFEIQRLSNNTFYGYWGSIGDIYVDFIEDKKGDIVAAKVDYLLGTSSFRKVD